MGALISECRLSTCSPVPIVTSSFRRRAVVVAGVNIPKSTNSFSRTAPAFGLHIITTHSCSARCIGARWGSRSRRVSARRPSIRPCSSIATPSSRVDPAPTSRRAPKRPAPKTEPLTPTRLPRPISASADSRFTQQQLPAWRPTLTPMAVRPSLVAHAMKATRTVRSIAGPTADLTRVPTFPPPPSQTRPRVPTSPPPTPD